MDMRINRNQPKKWKYMKIDRLCMEHGLITLNLCHFLKIFIVVISSSFRALHFHIVTNEYVFLEEPWITRAKSLVKINHIFNFRKRIWVGGDDEGPHKENSNIKRKWTYGDECGFWLRFSSIFVFSTSSGWRVSL